MNNIDEKYALLLNDFTSMLKETFKDTIVSAILYGSVAKGSSRKDSDIDICLIFKSLPGSRHKRTLMIFPLIKAIREKKSYRALSQKGYIPEISPVLYTVKEIQNTKPIFLDMIEEGIILIDDGTFKKKAEALKQRMRELNTHKVFLEDGDYYWVLKPGLSLGEKVVI